MQLNDEQRRCVVAFLGRTWPDSASCPMCRHNQWAIKNRLFEVSDYSEGKAQRLQSSAMPLVAVMCEHCGYCILLDAVKLGVVSATETRDKSEPGVG